MVTSIFIDGEAGTTGLQIRERLSKRSDIELIHLAESKRKCQNARKDAFNNADIVILCLPDESARQAISLIENSDVRIIDASSAHRVSDGWTYGFPEYNALQSEKIANSLRITNPGCYAIASVSMLYPLVVSKILPYDFPITINAISGYSGGGRQMISTFEDNTNPEFTHAVFHVYGLSLEHKHIPEIQKYSGLAVRPLFVPSVGRFRQGMVVQIPLQLCMIPGKPRPRDVQSILQDHYEGCPLVTVLPFDETKTISKINPEKLKNTDELHILLFSNSSEDQVIILGMLDNLGKGASGQVIQNLDILLGFNTHK